MSPVSRGRQGKKNKKSSRRLALSSFAARVECDRPSCSGEDFDPQRLIDELIAGAVELVEAEDPLDAEIAGAAFVSVGELTGEIFEDALVGGFIPQFEARGRGAGDGAGDRFGCRRAGGQRRVGRRRPACPGRHLSAEVGG